MGAQERDGAGYEGRVTMKLEEAIKHAEEKADGNTRCACEHEQLAKWLKELKELRSEKMGKILIKNELSSLYVRIVVCIATIVLTLSNLSWANHLGFGIVLKSMCMLILVLTMAFFFSSLSQIFYLSKLKRLADKFDNSPKVHDARVKLSDIQDMLVLEEDWWEVNNNNEMARIAMVKSALVCVCVTLAICFLF